MLDVMARAVSQVDSNEDLTAWLADRWWAPLTLCVLFCVVGLWMIRSMVIHRGRNHQVRRAAAAAGMSFSDQDAYGLSRTSFRHFASGADRGWTAFNVVTSRGRDGLPAHAFDARSWSELDVSDGLDGDLSFLGRRSDVGASGFSRVVRRHRGATVSAAMTELPLDAPRLMVARENVASKLFAAATRLDFDVESELFNRSYHVICNDRRFAQTLLDARVVDLMARTEGKVSFELFGSRALLATVLVEPELVPGLVRLAEELRSVVPQLAIDRWPRRGAVQTGFTATPR